MASIKNALTRSHLKQAGTVICCLVVIFAVLLVAKAEHLKSPPDINVSCESGAPIVGTLTLRVHAQQTANYSVWIHLETPVPISFKNVVGVYNPLFVLVDNNTCYRVGGNDSITPNTWTWVNSLVNSPTPVFRVHFVRGNHKIVVGGNYESLDQIYLLTTNCVPSGSGGNCSSPNQILALIH